MQYKDYEQFKAETGLIDNDDELKEIGASDFIGSSENGRFETGFLAKLREFCQLNPQYHIATATSDSDEVESSECETRARQSGLMWEEMSDEEQEEFREKEEIYAFTIDNQIRLVNRLDYYLARGNSDPQIFLEEIGG